MTSSSSVSTAKRRNHYELFDLKKDPAELNNLYDNSEKTGKVAEMKAELARLRAYYYVPDEEVVMLQRDKSNKETKEEE